MIWFGFWSWTSPLPAPGSAPSPVLTQPLHEGMRLGVGGELLLLRGQMVWDGVQSGQMGAPQLSVQVGNANLEGRAQLALVPTGLAGDVAAAWHRAPQGPGGTDLALGAGISVLRQNILLFEEGTGIAPYAELRGAHHHARGFSVPFSVRAGVAQELESAQSAPFAELSVGAAWQTESCWEVGIGVVGSTTVEVGELRAQAGLSCRLDQVGS